jgi:hypothetical protein
MRWRIGNYEMKYNPSQVSKSYRAVTGANMNVDGTASNTNLLYEGTQNFTVELYEKPTSVSRTPTFTFANGLYIGIAEDRVFEDVYLLKTNSVVDVKKKNGTAVKSFTITGGSITLPSGNPITLCHMDSEVAFLYRDATSSTILITDENGIANRKYIYSNALGDVSYLDSIGYNYDQNLYVANPYGKIYTINKDTGVNTFIMEFDDFSANKSGAIKKYKSLHIFEKQGNLFIGLLVNGDIIYLNELLEVSCKAETKMSNIVHISYSNYTDKYFILMSTNVKEMTANTCRLDIEIIKQIIASGMVTVYNELNLAHVMTIRSMRVNRKRNMGESRYELSLDGTIAYSNQTFGGQWFNITR